MKKLLSLLCIMLLALVQITFAQYGGSPNASSSLTRDDCPDGDTSESYYDGSCGEHNVAEEEIVINTVTVMGWIYEDENENGQKDTGEDGIQGAVVTLKTLVDDVVGTDITGTDGMYGFYEIAPGEYKVHVALATAVDNSWRSALLTLIAPSVVAATEYEFTITVEEEDAGDTIVSAVPVKNGSVVTSSVTTTIEEGDEEITEEEVIEDIIEEEDEGLSIWDLIRNRSTDTDNTSTTTTVDNSEGGFTLPEELAPTGVSL